MSEPKMTEEWAISHGCEWVAAGWTWAFGQVGISWADTQHGRVAYTGVVAALWEGEPCSFIHLNGGFGILANVVPDPRDDGFIGHALAQTRRRWPGHDVIIIEWAVVVLDGPHVVFTGYGDTDSERLLAAMRAGGE